MVLSAGVHPDVKHARKGGSAIGPTVGLEVDRNMRTRMPTIYTCGDWIEIQDMVRVYKMPPISYDINIFRSCENAISYSIGKLGAATKQFP